MKRSLSVLMLALSVAVPAAGQLIYHTIPQGYDTLDGGTYSGVGSAPFGSAAQSRWQWTYRWDSVYHQFPITVFELQFRRSTDAALAGAVYSQVDIRLASSATTHLTTVATFANNLGPDQTLVYSGPVTIPAYTATGANPAPWLVTIPLQIPFPFDATRRRDLVIDVQVSGAVPVGGGGFPIDHVFPSNFVSQNGHRTDPNSPVSDWFNNNAGAIVNLGYIPGSPAHFDLQATTSGGGVGDITALFSSIPMGTTEGYTLVSMTPAAAMGFDYGKGPALGLFPDPTTFGVLLTPLAAGDPLHWTYPAPGLFPDTALVLPPGTFAANAGQTWEVCGAALGPFRNLLGVTAVRQITF